VCFLWNLNLNFFFFFNFFFTKNLKALSCTLYCTISPRAGGQNVSKVASIRSVTHGARERVRHETGIITIGTASHVSTLCLPDITTRDQISQAILQVIKHWRWERYGNEANRELDGWGLGMRSQWCTNLAVITPCCPRALQGSNSFLQHRLGFCQLACCEKPYKAKSIPTYSSLQVTNSWFYTVRTKISSSQMVQLQLPSFCNPHF